MSTSPENEPVVTMTQEQVRNLVRSTVDETLTRFGVDTEDPIEIQRDFQFIRDWRKSTETVKGRALFVAITFVITGALGALTLGIKIMILTKP